MDIEEKIDSIIMFHNRSDFEEDGDMGEDYTSTSDLFEVTTREYINRDGGNYKTTRDITFKGSTIETDGIGWKFRDGDLIPARHWTEGFTLLSSHEDFTSLI